MWGDPIKNWQKLTDEFIESKRARQKKVTVDWYRARLDHWLNFCRAENLSLKRVSTQDLDRFAGNLKEIGFAFSTRQGTIQALRSFFLFLYEEKGSIKKNPFDKFKSLRPERSVIQPIPLDYCYQMIRAAERAGSLYGLRDAAIMRLLLTTGARRAEVTGLDLGDIDLDHGQAILAGKFDHRRLVPLRSTTITAIKLWLSDRPLTNSQALFVNIHSNSASPTGIYQRLRPSAINERLIHWRQEAGLPAVSVSPHKWRHRFASEMNRAGDPFSLSHIMGHADIKFTQRYVHSNPEDIRDLVIRFGPDYPNESDMRF